ncbi:MAG: Zn-ribbon domain-containing OB-fold protein [Candidatus Eisenbacteria bacterium]
MPPARSWRKYPQTYRLEAARCKKCGQTSFPPRLICPECRGRDFETYRMKRTGTVVTHTVVRTPSQEFAGLAPFAVGIVQMDDGPRLTVQIADVEFDELRIGMPVRLEFRRIYSEGEAGVILYGHKAVPLRS